MSNYLIGSDLIGAAAPDSGGPYVTVHVNNLNDLVSAQGGGVGTVANALLPQTIQATVYSKLADQLSAALKQNGVQADVKVVTSGVPTEDVGSDLLPGMVIGAGIVGLCYGALRLYRRHHKK